MQRSTFLVLGLFIISTPALSQTTSTDSQTLQALPAEVRQLRQDLQTTTVAAQRAQILLYRLQVQEAAVSRASQHLADARAKLAETQSARTKLAAQIKSSEDFVHNTENPPAGRKQIEGWLPQGKARLESLESEEQQRQTREIEAEEQRRMEQAKLGGLQDRLDQIEKVLENLSQQQGSIRH
jgi:DNA repair exonuclease SbcCD ATPase subunit